MCWWIRGEWGDETQGWAHLKQRHVASVYRRLHARLRANEVGAQSVPPGYTSATARPTEKMPPPNLYADFDFHQLDDPEFKEDSVREELVLPLLRALGYGQLLPGRIQRAKKLHHPVVRIGTKRRSVTNFVVSVLRRAELAGQQLTFDEIVLHVMPLLKNGVTPENETILKTLTDVAERVGNGRWRLQKHAQFALFH